MTINERFTVDFCGFECGATNSASTSLCARTWDQIPADIVRVAGGVVTDLKRN